MALPGYRAGVHWVAAASAWSQAFQELWFNARPILAEVALTALLMGFAFPLGNAAVQRVERSVGKRAGLLYLSSTAGAVTGSLTTGFVLLPMLGIQRSATFLMVAAGVAMLPLHLASRRLALDGSSTPRTTTAQRHRAAVLAPAASILAAATLGLWLLLPSRYVIMRAQVLARDNERLLTLSEGITEVIAVEDV